LFLIFFFFYLYHLERFFGKLEKSEDDGDENFGEGKVVIEKLELIGIGRVPQHAIVGKINALLCDLCERSSFGIGGLFYINK
jgi:hypothetical protein